MLTRMLFVFVLGFLLAPMLCLTSYGQQEAVTPAAAPKFETLTVLPPRVLEAELRSASGSSFKLSDYAGKVLLINLWATWGGPSRLETPELVKLQDDFFDDDVKVVGLSIEDPETSIRAVLEWIRNFRVNYNIGWATNDVALTLMQGRDAIPQTFVISRTGRIVKRFIGFNQVKTPLLFREAIKEALKEN